MARFMEEPNSVLLEAPTELPASKKAKVDPAREAAAR